MRPVLIIAAAAALIAANPALPHDDKPKQKAKPEAAKDGQTGKTQDTKKGDHREKGHGHDKKH